MIRVGLKQVKWEAFSHTNKQEKRVEQESEKLMIKTLQTPENQEAGRIHCSCLGFRVPVCRFQEPVFFVMPHIFS